MSEQLDLDPVLDPELDAAYERLCDALARCALASWRAHGATAEATPSPTNVSEATQT